MTDKYTHGVVEMMTDIYTHGVVDGVLQYTKH